MRISYLITFSVSIAILVFLFALQSYLKKKPRPEYDIKTRYMGRHMTLSSFLFWVGLIIMWVGFALCLSNKTNEYIYWNLYVIGMTLSTISIAILLKNRLFYEAAKDDGIIISRFNKTIIKISDIHSLIPISKRIIFLDGKGEKLASLPSNLLGLAELLEAILKQNNKLSSRFEVVKASNRGRIAFGLAFKEEFISSNPHFSDIGREYREDYKRRKRDNLLYSLSISIMIIAILVVFAILGETLFALFLAPFAILPMIVSHFSFSRRERFESALDDKHIGAYHYLDSNKTIGHHLKNRRRHISNLIISFLLLVGIGSPILAAGAVSSPVPFEDMVKVEGVLDDVKGDYFSSYYAFSLKGDECEYRLSLSLAGAFSFPSFYSSSESGDKITLYASDKIFDSPSRFYQDISKYRELYCFSTERDAYLPYDLYRSHENEENLSFVISGSISIGVGLLVSSFYLCRLISDEKKKTEENIDIFSD